MGQRGTVVLWVEETTLSSCARRASAGLHTCCAGHWGSQQRASPTIAACQLSFHAAAHAQRCCCWCLAIAAQETTLALTQKADLLKVLLTSLLDALRRGLGDTGRLEGDSPVMTGAHVALAQHARLCTPVELWRVRK